jgi:hypothetical protein
MYRWIVFIHILGAFSFVLLHGASAAVSLRLRTERNLERIRALLDLSTAYTSATYASLLLLLAAGVVAGFVGKWWGQTWIWVSLATLIALMAAMFALGTAFYARVRKAAGMEFMDKMKPHPPIEPAQAELETLLRSSRPTVLALLGGVGLGLLLWLMMFKPF